MSKSKIGDTLDAANAQEDGDCEEEGVHDHPDFLVKDPEELAMTEVVRRENMYRKIELYEDETIEKMSRGLDEDQRFVLDKAITYAKNLVKAENNRNVITNALLVIIQGGAGSGKSEVIDVVSQQVERVLRKAGDNPSHPYILKAAFTGTAAAKIRGQTLHSSFSFNFGTTFMSLSER